LIKSHDLLVSLDWVHYCTYICDLSNQYSTGSLQFRRSGKGNLILGWASRLYAFSAYPCRT